MTTFINEITTTNIPHTISASVKTTLNVTKKQALTLIEALVVDKTNWEQNAYKSSNDLLYSLLQRCYGYYCTMCEDNNNGKAARDGLKQYIEKKKLSFKDSTHSITKIVKCVFGADRRRVSAYSIALRTAYANNVKPLDLADFIVSQGGVEEIRLAKSKTALTPQEKIDIATAVITSTVLFKIKSPDVSKQLDTSNIGKQIVLIATQGAEGELTINSIISSEAAVKAALVAYYSINKKASAEAAKVEIAKQPQQAAAEAVDAAAVKLAA